jgi:serine/threonine protein kinase
MLGELRIVIGENTGKRLLLVDGVTATIGRGQQADFRIPDASISRLHASVQVDQGQAIIMDLGSTAGTIVNGRKVESHRLAMGDTIKLGDTQLRFQPCPGSEPDPDSSAIPFAIPATPPTSAKQHPLQDLTGQVLNNYELGNVISAGTNSVVFRGRDVTSNQAVAVKVLIPNPQNREEQKERFVRAMKTMLPVRHANIVQLLSAGKTGPYCWAAMELIDGESLSDVIERIGIEGMLDWKHVWRVAFHIGRALQEAESRKIIHRNVTPKNILQRKSDKVCLLGDLMLAKALEGAQAHAVTQPGQFVGDAPYLSPERTRDDVAVDHRSDLYGLGATCYAMLTGKPPAQGNNLSELILNIRSQSPAPPRQFQLSIDDKFEDTVLKLLAKNPQDRFQSASQLLNELERIGRCHNLKID